MGMNSIGIIPGRVLNLHPAPLLPAMYRYLRDCLVSWHPALAPPSGPAAITQQRQPTNRFLPLVTRVW